MNPKRIPLIVAIAAALLIAAFANAQPAQVDTSRQQKGLVGSWNVVVTTEVQGTTFPALLTFGSDGTLIADETPSPFETSGHGNWVRTNRHRAAYTFVALIGSAEGPLSAKLKVVGTLQYDASSDTWSGPFKIDVFDPSDQVVLSDRGIFSLSRIAVESLD